VIGGWWGRYFPTVMLQHKKVRCNSLINVFLAFQSWIKWRNDEGGSLPSPTPGRYANSLIRDFGNLQNLFWLPFVKELWIIQRPKTQLGPITAKTKDQQALWLAWRTSLVCMAILFAPASTKWPGWGIYIGHQHRVAICSHYALFCVGIGLTSAMRRFNRSLMASN